MTVLLLTGFLATILMRVLKNDFIKFSRDDEAGSCPVLTWHEPALTRFSDYPSIIHTSLLHVSALHRLWWYMTLASLTRSG